MEQILQLRIRKRVVIRLRGSVSQKKRRSAAQIGKVEAECGDLIWYNCRQWAAPATELPPCRRRDSIPSHQRCSAQRGPSRTAAPRRAVHSFSRCPVIMFCSLFSRACQGRRFRIVIWFCSFVCYSPAFRISITDLDCLLVDVVLIGFIAGLRYSNKCELFTEVTLFIRFEILCFFIEEKITALNPEDRQSSVIIS